MLLFPAYGDLFNLCLLIAHTAGIFFFFVSELSQRLLDSQMAPLVDKIKQRVRSRSSRHELNSNLDSPDHTDTPASPSRVEAFPRTSLENSAFLVSRGGASAQKASDASISHKPLPRPNGSAPERNQRSVDVDAQPVESEKLTPGRLSSQNVPEQARLQDHNRGQSLERGKEQHQEEAIVGEMIPERSSSNRTETTPRTIRAVQPELDSRTEPQPAKINFSRIINLSERPAPKPSSDAGISKPLPEVPQKSETQPRNVPGQESDGSAPSARDSWSNPAWMGPVISRGQEHNASQTRQTDNDGVKHEAMARGHLRLPDKFDLRDTEETHVYQRQRPAVTHETIIKERHEITQEAITRDIHIHHYYTYLQPVRVVEILPPKHFLFDPETGKKTEIPQPFGWTMPENMFPTSPDMSSVVGWTRHYLVNEEHPYGIPEPPPPLKHEKSFDNLRKEAEAQQS